MLEHHDIWLSVAQRRFVAEVIDDGMTLRGRWARTVDRWLALIVARGRATQGSVTGVQCFIAAVP
jgi:hypothetical protein